MTKEEIRKEFKKKRKSLSEAEVTHLSRLICDRFFAYFELSFIKTLHVYLPMAKFNEPDTWLILDRIKRE